MTGFSGYLNASVKTWLDGLTQAVLMAFYIFVFLSSLTKSLDIYVFFIICGFFPVISMLSLLVIKNNKINVKTAMIYLLSLFINFIFLEFISVELSQRFLFFSYRELNNADGLILLLLVITFPIISIVVRILYFIALRIIKKKSSESESTFESESVNIT